MQNKRVKLIQEQQQMLEFKKFIWDQGLFIVRQRGDGNCLFRAIGNSIRRSHVKVRRQITEYAATHVNKLLISNRDVGVLRTPGTHGGDQAIAAACYRFRVNILLYSPQTTESMEHHQRLPPPRPTLPPGTKRAYPNVMNPEWSTIHIAHMNGDHFDRLVSEPPNIKTGRCLRRPSREVDEYEEVESDDDGLNSGTEFSDDEEGEGDYPNADELNEEGRVINDEEDNAEEMDDEDSDYVPSEDEIELDRNERIVKKKGSKRNSHPVLYLNPEYRFLGKTIYARGMDHFFVICMVPKRFDHNRNLKGSLERAAGGDVLFPYTFVSQVGGMMGPAGDADIVNLFNLYQLKLEIPFGYIDRYEWLSELILPHLILNAIKWKFNQNNMELLMRMRRCSLLHSLIMNYWLKKKSQIINIVLNVIQHSISPFCLISGNCESATEIHHFHLDRFAPTARNKIVSCRFMEYTQMFGLDVPDNPLFASLNKFRRNASGADYKSDVIKVSQLLDSYANAYLSAVHSLYVVLISDGENMENFETSDAVNIEKFPKRFNVIYVGCHKGVGIRRGHFHDDRKNMIFPYLSSSSRIFLLHTQEYLTQNEGRMAEAQLINYIRLYLRQMEKTTTRFPFLLSNIMLSPLQQQKLGPELQEETIKLTRDKMPFFTNDPSVPTRTFSNGLPYAFLQMDHPVMQDGPFLHRDFSVVREKYLLLQNRHNDKNIL